MNIVNKIKTILKDIKLQWKTPQNGNSVPYKEIAAYSIGGMGKDMVLLLASYLGLGIGNVFLGSVLNIRPLHIQTMSTIVIIIDIFFIALRAFIIDNFYTKWGRFRPFIVFGAIPIFLIGAIYMYLDFESMQYTQKLSIVFCFSLAMVLARPYYDGAFNNLGNVITQNTKERSKIISIYSLVYSLAPTIYGFLIPILSDLTGGYTDIRTYRYIVVPISFIGVFLGVFAAFGTKERFSIPKGYREKSNIFVSAKEIFKNKYWWITMISTWLAFAEWAVGNIFLWSFVYGSQNMVLYSILNFFVGSSALLAMILTPIALSKLGNKKVILIQNICNVIFLAILYLTLKNLTLLFIFWLLNSFVNYFSVVTKPVFSAEMNDYQQYISKKRLEGAMSFASQIGLPITIATGYFLPFVLEMVGITTNYAIMFEPKIRNYIFEVLLICGTIGSILNLLPLLFYDFNREKHKSIIRVINYRTMLLDYACDTLTDTALIKGYGGYLEYQEIMQSESLIKSEVKNKCAIAINENKKEMVKCRKNLKVAKIQFKKATNFKHSNIEELENVLKNIKLQIKQYKKNISEEKKKVTLAKMLILAKKESSYFTKELNLINDANYILKINLYKQTVCNGYHNIKKTIEEVKESALHNSNKIINKHLNKLIKTQKMIDKKYNGNLIKPDDNAIEKAKNLPYDNKEQMNIRYKAIKKAVVENKKFHLTISYFSTCMREINLYNSSYKLDDIGELYLKANNTQSKMM